MQVAFFVLLAPALGTVTDVVARHRAVVGVRDVLYRPVPDVLGRIAEQARERGVDLPYPARGGRDDRGDRRLVEHRLEPGGALGAAAFPFARRPSLQGLDHRQPSRQRNPGPTIVVDGRRRIDLRQRRRRYLTCVSP